MKIQTQKNRRHLARLAAASTALATSWLLLLSSFVALATGSAAAAPAPTTKGSITVRPAIVNLTLPSGQQQATSTLMLENTYSKPIRLAAEWQAIDEATGRLIPSGPLNQNLAQSLRVSETDIEIPAQSSKKIDVTVQNSPTLAPGGHYAILEFTIVASGKEKLGLQSALSVTVFVVKRDGAITSVSLDKLTASHSLFSLPGKASLTITNTGNVHVVPRAAITIEKNGDVVAKAIVNEASSPLLPGKKATYNVSFTQYKRLYWPSHLQLRAVYRVDQSGDVQQRLSSFWYIPPIWPFILIVFGLAAYFLIRKGRSLLQRFLIHVRKTKAKHRAKPRTTETTENQVNPEPSKASKIPVSTVEISPSHAVPVERVSESKTSKLTDSKKSKKANAKSTTKKK